MDCLNCKQVQALIPIKLFLEQFTEGFVLLTGYKKVVNVNVYFFFNYINFSYSNLTWF